MRFTKSFIRNRQNPLIRSAFKTLLRNPRPPGEEGEGEEEALLVNHDRFGLFRPTVDFPEQGKSHPKWKSSKGLHIDINPWAYSEVAETEGLESEGGDAIPQAILDSLTYEDDMQFIKENNEVGMKRKRTRRPRKDAAGGEEGEREGNEEAGGKGSSPLVHIQGQINLIDNKEEDGGFQLVPGFHPYIEEFARLTPGLKEEQGLLERFTRIPKNNPIHSHSPRVSSRRGSLILWNQRLPHGSAPNNSGQFRAAQFLKIFPASHLAPQTRRIRREAILERLKTLEMDHEITELGRKLFGLDEDQ